VVGAGSAGAALAARLSEDPARRVLLLEAGRDWRAADAPHALRSANIIPFMHDPAHQAEWQWPGLMTRRTAVQEPRFYWRGRALGGSSTVNAQIAIRGVPAAFDAWAEAGCEGWAASDVLPLFDAIEDDADTGVAPGTRQGGPLPVYRASLAEWGAVDNGLREAALAAGYAWQADLNAPTGEGVACNPINSRGGRRVTTNDAYLEPARGRANLEIRGGATVDRVLFDGTRASGLRVRLPEGWVDLPAREIVLCAGAIHSPAILMRSGIGPAAALTALGIAVLRDQPSVGANFMDHPILRATLALRPEFQAHDPDARHTNCCLTYSSGLGGGGVRDMIVVAYNHRGGLGARPAPEGAVGVALYDAFSRGVLRLTSPDPDAQPVVEENMLDDPRDRLRMRDGLRRLARLVAESGLARLAERITFGDTALTMAEAVALPDGELDTLMLQQASDIQHAAGTCRMTAHEDPRGVVDPELRVRGVQGLRVADASIMPTDCRANLHFTCVMIGEMLARRMRR
jgi:5-(hydroxymethyl)furfural/furfural oxidase